MYKNREIAYLKYLSLLFIFIVASCTLKNSQSQKTEVPVIEDDAWLTDIPCKAPCWNGLEPGKTTQADAIKITSELPFIYDLGPSQSFDFYCKGLSGSSCLTLTFSKGILNEIFLSRHTPISFEEVVKIIGNPDGFIAERRFPETGGCIVILLWKERQMEIRYYEDTHLLGRDLCQIIEINDNKIPPNLLVYEVYYMQKSLVQEAVIKANFQTWNGFISNQ
jgi:hypothetical protein